MTWNSDQIPPLNTGEIPYIISEIDILAAVGFTNTIGYKHGGVIHPERLKYDKNFSLFSSFKNQAKSARKAVRSTKVKNSLLTYLDGAWRGLKSCDFSFYLFHVLKSENYVTHVPLSIIFSLHIAESI